MSGAHAAAGAGSSRGKATRRPSKQIEQTATRCIVQMQKMLDAIAAAGTGAEALSLAQVCLTRWAHLAAWPHLATSPHLELIGTVNLAAQDLPSILALQGVVHWRPPPEASHQGTRGVPRAPHLPAHHKPPP